MRALHLSLSFGIQANAEAGGVELSGVGIGASNATEAGGDELSGVGIGASNATDAGGVELSGLGIGASNATEAGGDELSGVGIGASNATDAGAVGTARWFLRFPKATNEFSVDNTDGAEWDGIAEKHPAETVNASAITDRVILINY